MTETHKRIFLIDGSAFIHRAFHAIRSLTNSKGMPTNAVFGFTRMLIKLFEEKSPEYAVMLFDAKGPTFRHDIFPEYKANRPPMPDDLSAQIPLIKKVVKGFRIPVIEMTGYEADDLIGTLARLAEDDGFEVTMVTGDKDFIQLITSRCAIWDPMKDEIVDQQAVENKYGVQPAQMIDVMGLSGDSTDNIPGVPGIGPKTALNLIQNHGSIESLYRKLDGITQQKLKANLDRYRSQAQLSRRLVEIDTCVDLTFRSEAYKVGQPDSELLANLFQELEFRQLQQTYQKGAPAVAKTYRAVLTPADLKRLVQTLEKVPLIAVDTETTSQDPMQARLVGVSVAWVDDQAHYIPCGHIYPNAPAQLAQDEVLAGLRPVLENAAIRKVGQNIKYDLLVLDRHGIDMAGVDFDTMLASYLINPSKRSHGLDQIALDFLNHKTTTYETVVGKDSEKLGLAGVPLEKAVPYACEDADITLQARNVLRPRLENMGLLDLFDTVEMPLVPVLMRMEKRGIGVDRAKLVQLSRFFARRLERLESDIYESAGESFNIQSSQQLGRILFEKLKLPVQKKTKKKTAFSTDVSVLTTLARDHQLPALVLEHRSIAKLKSTYADALIQLIHPETGRLHTSYNQTIAATGRLSSSDPNLQNIPIRSEEGREIRRAFVPREDWTLLSADYSQIELRILAHLSDDPILIQAFKDDEDIHTRTAAEVFQIDAAEVGPELRRQAKAINFGIIYGMSPYGLSLQLEISQKMAKVYIDHYFERYQGVRAYIDRTIQSARQTKQTSTLLGRVRLLPEIASSNYNIRQFAERTAVNTPVQGTAADFIKLAMIRIDQAIREKDLEAGMLLSVHDELVFEVPPNEIEPVADLVQQHMESVWPLQVPLKVNLSRGDNWAAIH